MTESEIIQSLECCANWKSCKECPLYSWEDCTGSLKEFALDLINRKNAEIERKDMQIEELVSFQRFCENKAIKEFAERAEKRICEKVNAPTPTESYIVEKCIGVVYQIAKEMGCGE